jgi:hypothetical protein
MAYFSHLRAIAVLFAALAGVFLATSASAQATRTWVSGVGDDVNPCSRTAPCKTFAGAISKTAAGGEINCLDPGGFGAVTITKSITISCPYTEGGVLAGGNGIVINDSASPTPGTALVYLRGLDIVGVSPPTHGVRFISGASLVIEDSVVRRFNAANSFGISFQPAGPAQLFVRNVTIADNGLGSQGGGINVQPTGAGTAQVTLENVRLVNNANVGFRTVTAAGNGAAGIVGLLDDVTVARTTGGITSVGIQAFTVAGAPPASLMVVNSNVSHNSGIGINANGSLATIRVANTNITGNNVGVEANGGSSLKSYGNNRNDGNTNDGAFILPNITQE